MSLNLSLFPPSIYGYGPVWGGFYPRYWSNGWGYPRPRRGGRFPFRRGRRSRGHMSHSQGGAHGGIDANGDGIYSQSELARFMVPSGYVDWEGQEEEADGGGVVPKTCAEIRERLAKVGEGVSIRNSLLRNAGKGLFAARDFDIGEPITEFSAFLLDAADSEALQREGRDTNLLSHVRGVWNLDGRRTPDGKLITSAEDDLRGLGGASYANDAPPDLVNARFTYVDCESNHLTARELLDRITTVEEMMRALPIGLKPRERVTMLVATRNIKAGDEIFASWSRDDVYGARAIAY
jgi:hypothetical protein